MQQRAYNKFLHIYIIDINICKKTDMEKKLSNPEEHTW